MTIDTRFFLSATALILLVGSACGEKVEPKPEPAKSVNAVATEAAETKAPAAPTQATNESPCKMLASLTDVERPKIPQGANLQKAFEGSGSLSLPAPGAPSDGETHTRHAWTMPRNASNAIAVIRWADTTWGDVQFAVGTGICPHRGVEMAKAVSSTGTGVVHYEHSPDRAWPEPDWFLHVNADKALETKAGEELKYDYEICVY